MSKNGKKWKTCKICLARTGRLGIPDFKTFSRYIELSIEIPLWYLRRGRVFYCLSFGPFGICGKIFLISKNLFLSVTTLTFPDCEILDWLVFSPLSRHAPYNTATAIAHGSFPNEIGSSFIFAIIWTACLSVLSLIAALLAILAKCDVESIEGSRILSLLTNSL